MRRWIAVVAIACVLTLTACSNKANAHAGAATKPNGSVSPSSTGAFSPAVGDCFFSDLVNLTAAEKVPCTQQHVVEETYIGKFTGSGAALASPPVDNSADMRNAFTQCDAATKRYVAGDWREGLIELELKVPDRAGWTSGARWFRCGVSGIAKLDYDTLFGTNVSFRGVLAKSSEWSARCITWSGTIDDAYNFVPKSCASPHKGEYAGAYIAPVGPYPSTTKKAEDLASDGCGDVVAHFVGFSSWSQFDNSDIGYYELGFDESQWNMGDRSVRCYAAAYTKDGEFVGSVKGIKGRTPKS